MSYRVAAAMVVLAGTAGFAAVLILAPGYLISLGFPLDDAWTYAVYARSVARSGTFAYNPGFPATGVVSPLWTLILAVPQWLASDIATFVLGAKLLGFTLHIAASLLMLRALGDGVLARPAQVAGALFVALHPDLVSASMSGIEVPLANLAAVGLLLAASRSSALLYGVVCFLAPLARPELTALCVAVPVALFLRRSHRRLGVLLGAAVVGNVVSYAVVGLRNLAVSGMALPAAFHARPDATNFSMIESQAAGWGELLARFPIADSSILLVVAALVAGRVVISREPESSSTRNAAAAFLPAIAFCATSFAMFPPVDAEAFSSQRFVLPVLPLIVGSMPVLLCDVLPRRLLPARPARLVQFGILGVFAASVLVSTNVRLAMLASDARSVDDVQVSMGKHLASASQRQTVWAVDAGAVRYFGSAFVVDLLGVNSAEMLGPNAGAFLAEHRPRYIETVAELTQLDVETPERLEAIPFRTSVSYPANTYQTRPQHWIVMCSDPDVAGQVVMRDRRLPFRCAPPMGSRSTASR